MTPFHGAVDAAVSYLTAHAPLDLWLVTRVEAAEQVVVAADGAWSGDAEVGAVLPWVESFCVHMAAGTAPSSVADVTRDPRYAAAATGRWSKVRGYTGVPLLSGTDELWGTLSGYTGRAHDPRLRAASVSLEVLASLLSSLLMTDAARKSADDRAEALLTELRAARSLADVDALTGLRNRRGWVSALATENERASWSATASGVVALDLDELKQVNDRLGHHGGDALLRGTAKVLARTCRRTDVIARPGGDEFTVLAVDVAPAEVESLAARLATELARDGIAASVGCAMRRPGEELTSTWARADSSMYDAKRRRTATARRPG